VTSSAALELVDDALLKGFHDRVDEALEITCRQPVDVERRR
jgi:hypothetical protein